MQILTQEVWGGTRVCISDKLPAAAVDCDHTELQNLEHRIF